jgi:coiled-coil domain-containing protein 12
VAPVSSSKALQNALFEAKQDTTNTTTAATVAVTSMAPKKINWDLKRDISDKLAKLERRTQKAIVGMLKERLELEATRAVNDSDDSDDSDLD